LPYTLYDYCLYIYVAKIKLCYSTCFFKFVELCICSLI